MIHFKEALPTNTPLFAYNNQVVTFYSDSDSKPLYCTIDLTAFDHGTQIRIFPNTQGVFIFNFSEYLSAILNTQNFADTTSIDVQNALVYDHTQGIFISEPITFTIYLADGSSQSTDQRYLWISGVEQLQAYQKGEFLTGTSFVLAPLKQRTNNTHVLYYWEGYPFDISFYNQDRNSVTIENQSTGLSIEVYMRYYINRIAFCDGSTDVTIENDLPLLTGYNLLKIADSFIELHKVEAKAGVYIKYRNPYGGWSYWLFECEGQITRNTTDKVLINNDFYNLKNTISPMLQHGKQSVQDTLKVWATRLDAEQISSMLYLLESPKIYLFTGDRFSRASLSHWIEVTCKTGSFKVREEKRQTYSFSLDFLMPNHNIITL